MIRWLFYALKKRLPHLSSAERQAMESGDTWWEAFAFFGRLDWDHLHDFEPEGLRAEEIAYLTDVVDPFCASLDNGEIEKCRTLPQEAWRRIAEGKLWGILLSKEQGGLGFSEVALAAIVCRIASRNISAAITVMVPNTVGPAAFIALHGTEEQKKLLPDFACGAKIGCFALTSTLAGSDAASTVDSGIVCRQDNELGLRLNWDKRYITLAPKAHYFCLAVRVSDPAHLLGESHRGGITLVLVSGNEPGVQPSHAHEPMTAGLANGTTQGIGVWVPLTAVIGGPEGIGQGWDWMMNELAAGRGLSLPSLASALCQMSLRMTDIYIKARRQFKRPLLAFSGIQAGYARLVGFAVLSRSVHWFTVQGLAKGKRPAIAAAVAKYHLTELARQSVNVAMDIHGGRAAQTGPRNYFTGMYQALPVMVTVEGANILTRHLIIFGQSLIRCHPFAGEEWQVLNEVASDPVLKRFERVFWRHVSSFCWRACQNLFSRLTGGRHFYIPAWSCHRRLLRRWLRLSQAFSWITDAYLLRFGGQLKENETISALLGDVVSYQYMFLAVWAYDKVHGEKVTLDAVSDWAMTYCLRQAQLALIALVRDFPTRWLRWLMRCIVFPTRLVYDEIKTKMITGLAQRVAENEVILDHLTADCYRSSDRYDMTGRMEALRQSFLAAAPALKRLEILLQIDDWSACFGNNWTELVELAESRGLAFADCAAIKELAERSWDALQVD